MVDSSAKLGDGGVERCELRGPGDHVDVCCVSYWRGEVLVEGVCDALDAGCVTVGEEDFDSIVGWRWLDCDRPGLVY